MGLEADPEDCNLLFEMFDDDGGGTIEYGELAKALRPGRETDAELERKLKRGAIERKGTVSLGALAGRKREGTGRAASPLARTAGRGFRSRHSSGGSSAGRSKGGRTSASGMSGQSGEREPRSYAESVYLDSQRSPDWREYLLNLQVLRMLEAKDRSLPMTATVRSPRHMQAHSTRFVPPIKPKPQKKKKKQATVETDLVFADAAPLSCCDRLGVCWQGLVDAIVGILNGFASQDLEVQIVILIVFISGCVNVYTAAVVLLRESAFEPGHAPPAPPVMPDWTVRATDAAMNYATSDPIIYLMIDYGIAVVIGALAFYADDIAAWQKARELQRRNQELIEDGYQALSEPGGASGDPLANAKDHSQDVVKAANIVKGWKKAAGVAPSALERAAALIDPDDGEEAGSSHFPLVTEADVRSELIRATDRVEELEIKLKVHAAADFPSDDLDGLENRIELHRERQKLLKEALKHMGGDEPEEDKDKEGGEGGQKAAAPPPKSGSLLSESQVNTISAILTVLKNSANGLISVTMFFADVSSDIAVIVLLWSTGNYVWAWQAIFFVVYQVRGAMLSSYHCSDASSLAL